MSIQKISECELARSYQRGFGRQAPWRKIAEGPDLAGQPSGEVGNTGNAATTLPHLHSGVYVRRRGMRGGARDPYEFLN